jgi:hypothetical protein
MGPGGRPGRPGPRTGRPAARMASLPAEVGEWALEGRGASTADPAGNRRFRPPLAPTRRSACGACGRPVRAGHRGPLRRRCPGCRQPPVLPEQTAGRIRYADCTRARSRSRRAPVTATLESLTPADWAALDPGGRGGRSGRREVGPAGRTRGPGSPRTASSRWEAEGSKRWLSPVGPPCWSPGPPRTVRAGGPACGCGHRPEVSPGVDAGTTGSWGACTRTTSADAVVGA